MADTREPSHKESASDPAPEDWRERAYWEALTRTELSASQDYDKAILTLSSGTLALSATFVRDIAPEPVACSLALLVGSWLAFVVAIIAVIVSYLTSQTAIRREAQNLNASRITNATKGLNYISGIGFIAGIVLFAVFALVNL